MFKYTPKLPSKFAAAILVLGAVSGTQAKADIDCEIILCIGGSFAPSECRPAYKQMIDNLKHRRPPFGICTLQNADSEPAGELEILNNPTHDYIRKARIQWGYGVYHDGRSRSYTQKRVTSCELNPKDKQLVAFGGSGCLQTYSRITEGQQTNSNNGAGNNGNNNGSGNVNCGRNCNSNPTPKTTVTGALEGVEPPMGRSVRFKHFDHEGNVSVTDWFSF